MLQAVSQYRYCGKQNNVLGEWSASQESPYPPSNPQVPETKEGPSLAMNGPPFSRRNGSGPGILFKLLKFCAVPTLA